MTETVIHFYKTRDAYGCFSNFYAAPFELDGRSWRTVEHCFQAMKFDAREHQEAIRAVASPTVAKRMGRSRKRPLREDWEAVKLEVMRRAVREKFVQNPALHAALLETGDAELVERAPRDRFWGDGGDGSGENWLGRILMEVRAALSQAAA